jgi:hypothetical protein
VSLGAADELIASAAGQLAGAEREVETPATAALAEPRVALVECPAVGVWVAPAVDGCVDVAGGCAVMASALPMCGEPTVLVCCPAGVVCAVWEEAAPLLCADELCDRPPGVPAGCDVAGAVATGEEVAAESCAGAVVVPVGAGLDVVVDAVDVDAADDVPFEGGVAVEVGMWHQWWQAGELGLGQPGITRFHG